MVATFRSTIMYHTETVSSQFDFIYSVITPFAVHYHTVINANLNSLKQRYIHFIQSTFPGIDTQPFEILLTLMYSRMVVMVVCWRYRMPFDANGCVSTLVNVD